MLSYRMDKNYGSQGFLILLCATVMVVLAEGLSGGLNWNSTQSASAVMVGADTLEAFHEEVAVNTPVLYGAESWDFLPAERAALSEIESPFARFFSSLDRISARKGRARIAYFGDSMIEGDLITQTLRDELQQMFGGAGVGFVPITSNTYSFRKSIWHRFSGDWHAYNFLKSDRTDFGISGEIFLARQEPAQKTQNHWVHYKGSDLFANTQNFSRATLFYGMPQDSMALSSPAYVYVSSPEHTDTLELNPRYPVNELLLTDRNTESLELSFHIPGDLPVYGVNFANEEGIHLDNFSSRGSSGRDLVEIPNEILQQFHHHLDYDLVVLHFGVNVTSARRKNFDSYERAMRRVINHIHENMPETDILMVSVGDRGIKLNGRWQTDPSVPLVREAQRRVAEEMGVGFLDLYRSMGGKNTMVRWVARDLAIHDHVHPTRRGAKKIAHIVKDYLLAEYETFSEQVASERVPGENLAVR